jgi:hypothetical protein
MEDILYKLGMKCRIISKYYCAMLLFFCKKKLLTCFFSLVHSFIIDIEDIFVKNEFYEEEIYEIIEKENG